MIPYDSKWFHWLQVIPLTPSDSIDSKAIESAVSPLLQTNFLSFFISLRNFIRKINCLPIEAQDQICWIHNKKMFKKVHISNQQKFSKPNIIKNVSHTWKENKTHYSFSWIKYTFHKCEPILISSRKNNIVSMRNSSSLSLPAITHCFSLFSSLSRIHRFMLLPTRLR